MKLLRHGLEDQERLGLLGNAGRVRDPSNQVPDLGPDCLTPAGMGMGKTPKPVFLKPGDVMTLGIHGLGEQRQDVVSWRRAAEA